MTLNFTDSGAHMLLLWLGLMIPLVFSPGPANLYIAGITSRNGFRSVLGLIAGISVINIAATFSVGILFQAILPSQRIYFEILKFIGLAYLIYLSIGLIRQNKMGSPQKIKHSGFTTGVLLQALNGKLYPLLLMMFTMILQSPAENSGLVVKLTLGFTTLCLASYLAWALLGSMLYRYLTDKTTLFIQRYCFGAMFCLVTIYLVFDTLREAFI